MNLVTKIGDLFQEVKNKTNLADVAKHLGANLDQHDEYTFQGTCPAGHPSKSGRSFHLNTRLGLFHCFNCKIGGDVITLVEEVKCITKVEALKWLIYEYQLDIDLPENLNIKKLSPEEIQEREERRIRGLIFEKIYEIGKQKLHEDEGRESLEYLINERGYDVDILLKTEWIYFPKDHEIKKLISDQYPEMKEAVYNNKLMGYFGDNFRLAFPYRERKGMITGFVKRANAKEGVDIQTNKDKIHKNVRWDSTKGLKKDDLFGLDKVDISTDTIIIVEGYPDALYLQALGLNNITAVGQGRLSNKQLSGLRKLAVKNLIISFDNDSSGPANTEEAVSMILKNSNITPYIIDPKEFGVHKDPDEYFKANGFEALKEIFDKKLINGILWIIKRITENYDTLNDIDKNKVKDNLFDILQKVRDENTLMAIHELLSKELFKMTLPAFKKLIKSKRELNKDDIIKSMIKQPIVPFIDMKTNSRCYYRKNDDILSLSVDEKMIDEIMFDHGLRSPSIYPAFTVVFNPQQTGRKFDLLNRSFNLFTPTEYMLKKKNGEILDISVECPRINELLCNLIPIDNEREHFFNWLSYIFSTREKARTAWVFTGIQGSGKNLFFDHVIKPLFGVNQTIVVDDDRLQSDFNGYMNNKLFVAFNEVANDETKTKRSVKSKIKALITDSTIIVNEKHIKTYEINNHANTLFFSNEVIPLLIEVRDRRFNVVKTGGKLDKIKSFMDNRTLFIQNLCEELPRFAQFLLNYNYDINLVDEVLENDAKSVIKELSMNRFELFAEKLKSKDWDWFDENYQEQDTLFYDFENRSRLMTKEELKSGKVLRETLLNSYNAINEGEVSLSKLTRQLKLYGVSLLRKKYIDRRDEYYYIFD